MMRYDILVLCDEHMAFVGRTLSEWNPIYTYGNRGVHCIRWREVFTTFCSSRFTHELYIWHSLYCRTSIRNLIEIVVEIQRRNVRTGIKHDICHICSFMEFSQKTGKACEFNPLQIFVWVLGFFVYFYYVRFFKFLLTSHNRFPRKIKLGSWPSKLKTQGTDGVSCRSMQDVRVLNCKANHRLLIAWR